MASYIYRPLKDGEIRVFRLSAGRFDDPLMGQLAAYSIDVGVPSYRALSYVWGDVISPTKLRILPSSSRSITLNLECALRYLRSPDNEVCLWVDALCINQHDAVEKAQQVGRMRDVYAIASEVVAFLGDDNNDDTGDLSLVARFAADAADAKHILPPETRDVVDHLRHGGEESPWTGLFNVLRRPWFSRIWVVQEALVARKLSFQCGAAFIAAPKLAEVLSQIDSSKATSFVGNSTYRSLLGSTLSGIAFIRKVASRELVAAHTKQKVDLLELLWTHRGYKATKARDHLFAVLGLANVPYNSLLSPDYESCLEVVVNRYARYFVQFDTKPLRLLYSAGGISVDNRFESWLPNWTLGEGVSWSLNDISRPFLEPPAGFYSTAIAKPASIRIGKGNRTLLVTGTIFSHLSAIGEDHWSTADQEDGMQVWVERHVACIQESDHFIYNVPRYPTGEKLEDVQIKLLVGNRARGTDSYRTLSENYGVQYSRFRKLLEAAIDPPDPNPAKDLYTTAKGKGKTPNYLGAFSAIRDLRFCLTKNDYLGLVPLATEIGDVVCIVHGSCVPFVIRPCKEIKGAFRLVGKCYIHGIMEGEALQMKDLVQMEISLV